MTYDPALDADRAAKAATIERLRAGWTPLAPRKAPDPWREPPAKVKAITNHGIVWETRT